VPGTSLGASQSLALVVGTPQWLTGLLTANLTVTLSAYPAGATARLLVQQDATGGRTLTVSVNGNSTVVPILASASATSEVLIECQDSTGNNVAVTLLNTPDASTTLKGAVRLATAPASASTPIAVGSNDPTLARNVVTTKGDLVVATAAGLVARVPVGTDTQALVADSTQTTGVKWANQSGAGTGPTLGVLSADLAALTASTTLTNVTGLAYSIGSSATEIWLAEWWIIVTATSTTEDIKFGFTIPAGCTGYWSTAAQNGWTGANPTVTPFNLLSLATTMPLGTPASGNVGYILNAVILGGGTAGAIQLQYAQNTSDAGSLTVKAGSMLRATQVHT